MYVCGACGKPILVAGSLRVRRCPHVDAPIIAKMTAKMEGRGGLR
jgi:DNA-directed RNA polymerase subunit RPC12/RpoP